ncbi:MAG: type VI secretion system tube protein Hcp [Pseudomonadota bacterium]
MALRMILDLNTVNGESQLEGYTDKIDIDQYSLDMHQSGTFHRGGGGAGGTCSMGDLMLSKKLDKSSADLTKKVCMGKHYTTAVLKVFKNTGDGFKEYYTITLNDCIVSSYSIGGSADGLDYIHENFSINFKQIQTQYMLQGADGILTDGGNMTYNCATEQGS